MPRGTATFNGEASNEEVSPLLLVRLLAIPKADDASTMVSLYLTDANEDVTWFNTDGNAQVYTSCGLKFASNEQTKDNEINQCVLSIDNVNSAFSSMALDYELTGVQCHVLRGFLSTLSSADGAQTLFMGHILSVAIGEGAFKATITPDFSLKTRVPRRLYWIAEFPYIPSLKNPNDVYTGS